MSSEFAPPVDRKTQLLSELRRRAGTDERKLSLVSELERRQGTQSPARPQSFDPTNPIDMVRSSVQMGQQVAEGSKIMSALGTTGAPRSGNYPDKSIQQENLETLAPTREGQDRMRELEGSLDPFSSIRETQAKADREGRAVGIDEGAGAITDALGHVAALPFSIPMTGLGLDRAAGKVMDATFGRAGRYVEEKTGSKFGRAIVQNVGPIVAGDLAFKGLGKAGEAYHGPSIPDAPLPVDPYAGGQTQGPGPSTRGLPRGVRPDIEPARIATPRTVGNEPLADPMTMSPSAVERVPQYPDVDVNTGQRRFPTRMPESPAGTEVTGRPTGQGGYASGLPGETLRVRPSMENYERGSTGRPAPRTVPAPRPPRPSIEPIREFNTGRTIPDPFEGRTPEATMSSASPAGATEFRQGTPQQPLLSPQLERAARRAGFTPYEAVREVVRAVQRGDETRLQMFTPDEVNALWEIGKTVPGEAPSIPASGPVRAARQASPRAELQSVGETAPQVIGGDPVPAMSAEMGQVGPRPRVQIVSDTPGGRGQPRRFTVRTSKGDVNVEVYESDYRSGTAEVSIESAKVSRANPADRWVQEITENPDPLDADILADPEMGRALADLRARKAAREQARGSIGNEEMRQTFREIKAAMPEVKEWLFDRVTGANPDRGMRSRPARQFEQKPQDPYSVADQSRTRSTAPLPPDVYYPDARGGVGGTGPGVPGSVQGRTPSPPAPGMKRLYRASAQPSAGKSTTPEWAMESLRRSGGDKAQGRWFVEDPVDELSYYQRDNPGGRVTYVDVPASQAEGFRVSNLPGEGRMDPAGSLDTPRRFSARPDKEFFLPSELASKASEMEFGKIGVSPGGRTRIPGGPLPRPDVEPASPGKPPGSPVAASSPPPPARTPPGGRVDLTAASEVPRPKPGAGAAVGSQFNEKIGNLKRFGNDFFYKAKEILGLKNRRTAGPVRDLQQNWDRMSKEEQAGLTPGFMQGRGQGTPAQTQFRDWWYSTSEPRRAEFTKSGVRVEDSKAPGGYREIYPNDKFYPQSPTPEILERLKTDPTLREQYFGEAKKQGFTPQEAEASLKRYHDPKLQSEYQGTHSAREFKWPDEWVNPNVHETLNKYLHRSYADAAETEVFRTFDTENNKPRNSGQGDLGDMIARLPRTEQQAARDAMLDILGRSPANWDPLHQASVKTSNAIGAVNALRLYGARPITTLVQSTTHAMTHALVGEGPMAKGLASIVTDPKGAYERAVRSGAVRPNSQFADVAGMHEEGSGKINKVTEAVLTPMAMNDMVGRVVASEAAPHFAAKIQSQLNGNWWRKGVARVNLEALDYSPADVETFRKGNLTQEQMDIFRQRVVERTQGEVTNASRIPLATSDVGVGPVTGRVFMQGKNFTVAAARNTWRIAGKQLIQAKNPIPAARLIAGTYLLGKGMSVAKDLLMGEDDKNRPGDTADSLKQGSIAGIVGDTAYAAIQGKEKLRQHFSRLSESQFEGMMMDLVELGYDEVSPPTDKRVSIAPNVPLGIPKDRVDMFLDAVRRIAPAGAEWEKIVDHVLGDDSIAKERQMKDAKIEYNKSKRVDLEAVR